MAKAVFCMSTSEYQAEAIVNEIKVAGFVDDDISVLLPDRSGGAPGEWQAKTSSGALGWLTGIKFLNVPGAGSFIAAGPIMNAITGAEPSGGISSALAGMGLPELATRHYEQRIRAGGILISVRADNPDQASRATSIFEQADAQDIAITADVAVQPKPPEVRDEKWEKW